VSARGNSKTRRKWIARLLLIPIVWLGYHGAASLISIHKLNRTKRTLYTQIQQLKARKLALESKKRTLESDSGVSVLAITRLGMEKEGEKVYKVDVLQGVDEKRVEP
jgi:cell division protein FtsB